MNYTAAKKKTGESATQREREREIAASFNRFLRKIQTPAYAVHLPGAIPDSHPEKTHLDE